jgi:hypothetical protein
MIPKETNINFRYLSVCVHGPYQKQWACKWRYFYKNRCFPSNWRCTDIFFTNPFYVPYIFTSAAQSWICHFSRSSFQHAWTMHIHLHGLPCHSYSVSQLWYFKVLKWGVQMPTRKDWRTSPCTFHLPQISDMLCEVVLCVEEWCICWRLLITKCTLQFMACLNVVSSTAGFPTGHKINQHSRRQFP